MKNSLVLVIGIMLMGMAACNENTERDGEFTGNQVSYALMPGSEWDFYGEVTIRERKDSSAQVEINIRNTEGDQMFPAHLHYDAFSEEADLAALLNPVDAKSGNSTTVIERIDEDKEFTYQDLISFDGHIKVHLDDGPNKDIILSYGNIGSNFDKPLDSEVAPCASDF